MYYKKEGMPEENELVLCTVSAVHYNSVFCILDEYSKKGMIHISEVSPGRIRNIRDYVQEGKKVVCKILRIDEEKGHIDLSLRRVTDSQRREKNAELKQEMRAEKLIENYAKQELEKDPKKIYSDIAKPILKDYEYLFMAFDEVVTEDLDLASLGVPKEYSKRLTEIIKEKIPPKKVSIKGKLHLRTHHEEGVELIKKALIAARSIDEKNIDINYLGNGSYKLIIIADDFEKAEGKLQDAMSSINGILKDGKGTATLSREDKK